MLLTLALTLLTGCAKEYNSIVDAVFDAHTDSLDFTNNETDFYSDSEALRHMDKEEFMNENSHKQIQYFRQALQDDFLSNEEKQRLISLGITETELNKYDWNFSWTTKQLATFPDIFGPNDQTKTKILNKISTLQLEKLNTFKNSYSIRYNMAETIEDYAIARYDTAPELALAGIQVYAQLHSERMLPLIFSEILAYSSQNANNEDYQLLFEKTIEVCSQKISSDTSQGKEAKEILIKTFYLFEKDTLPPDILIQVLSNHFELNDVSTHIHKMYEKHPQATENLVQGVMKNSKNRLEILKYFKQNKIELFPFALTALKNTQDESCFQFILETCKTTEISDVRNAAFLALKPYPQISYEEIEKTALDNPSREGLSLLRKIDPIKSEKTFLSWLKSSNFSNKIFALQELNSLVNNGTKLHEDMENQVAQIIKNDNMPETLILAAQILGLSNFKKYAEEILQLGVRFTPENSKKITDIILLQKEKALPVLQTSIDTNKSFEENFYRLGIILKIESDMSTPLFITSVDKIQPISDQVSKINELLIDENVKPSSHFLNALENEPFYYTSFLVNNFTTIHPYLLNIIQSPTSSETSTINTLRILKACAENNPLSEYKPSLVSLLKSSNPDVLIYSSQILAKIDIALLVSEYEVSDIYKKSILAPAIAQASAKELRPFIKTQNSTERSILANAIAENIKENEWQSFQNIDESEANCLILIAEINPHKKALNILLDLLLDEKVKDKFFVEKATAILQTQYKEQATETILNRIANCSKFQDKVDLADHLYQIDENTFFEVKENQDALSNASVFTYVYFKNNQGKLSETLLNPNTDFSKIKTIIESLCKLPNDRFESYENIIHKYVMTLIKVSTTEPLKIPDVNIEYAKAIEILDLVYQNDMQSEILYREYARLVYFHETTLNTDLAFNIYKSLNEMHPHHFEYLLSLGELAERKDKKISYFKEAIQSNPTDPQAYAMIAIQNAFSNDNKHNDLEESKKYLDQAMKIDSNHPLTIAAAARYYYMSKEYEKSCDYYLKLIEEHPDYIYRKTFSYAIEASHNNIIAINEKWSIDVSEHVRSANEHYEYWQIQQIDSVRQNQIIPKIPAAEVHTNQKSKEENDE